MGVAELKRKPRIPKEPTKELVKEAKKLAGELGYGSRGFPFYGKSYLEVYSMIEDFKKELAMKRK